MPSLLLRKDSANNLSFAGMNTAKVNFPSIIEDISKKDLNNIQTSLTKKISTFAPDFSFKEGSNFYYKKSNPLIETLTYPFLKLPREILNGVANKFNITSLKNSKMLQKYNQEKEQEACLRALRGLYKSSDEFSEKAISEFLSKNTDITKKELLELINNPNLPFEQKEGACRSIYSSVTDDFYKLFDSNLLPSKAKYHTPHERVMARIASGGTAAVMLGTDFYNKSILNGKSQDVAKEELKGKRKQELVATGMEAMSQYLMLGAFSQFANNSKWGAPILNTALAIFFHITSRLSTGRPITRIKPNGQQNKIEFEIPSVKDFAKSIKNHEKINFKSEIKEDNSNKIKDNKKHILSIKNIIFACLSSIVLGFAGRKIKSTQGYKALAKNVVEVLKLDKLKEQFKKATIGKISLSEKEYGEFRQALELADQQGLLKYLDKKIPLNAFENGNKLYIGEYEKTVKIPIIGEASKKELMQIPLSPFKLVKELFGYPYKIASKIYDGIKKGNVKNSASENKTTNKYNILNTYRAYKAELDKNNGKIDDKFISRFKDLMNKNQLSALNKETKSQVNNAVIGQTTQLLGTFGSIYFATTDDYNATIKQTGDIEKASKDARLRGVNKIIRIATQIVCMQVNQILKIPYAQSVLNAGLITVGCTVATDTISRFLSGMPSKRMNKEELEHYNQSKKQGILKGYYNLIDKITD